MDNKNVTLPAGNSLQRSRARYMFGVSIDDMRPAGAVVAHFVVGTVAYPADAGTVLRDEMLAVGDRYGRATCWLDIQAPAVPGFVFEVIEVNARAGTLMVVSFDGRCSHDAASPLHPSLVQAMLVAEVPGQLWHPVLKKMVYAFAV